jgi:hypothetical protein
MAYLIIGSLAVLSILLLIVAVYTINAFVEFIK